MYRKHAILMSFTALVLGAAAWASAAAGPQAPSSPSKLVGKIKSISGNMIVVAPDSGSDTMVQVQPSSRIIRVAPGQKDLKSATVLKLSDLSAGDRVVVRGQPATDGRSVDAAVIMAMKSADVATQKETERQQWQQHGTDGLVTAVDPAAGTVTIVSTGFGGKKTTVIHVSKTTIVRRYAPDSARFEDARVATLDQVKSGDQLRARGTKSAEGNDFNADEIVAGTFRNITGTVISADPAANTIAVMDGITKKLVTVKLSADSQMRKLPAEMAQRIAFRLKGEVAGNGQPGGSPQTDTAAPAAGSKMENDAAGTSPHRNGSPDLQKMLARAPAIAIADLHKGDAVKILSTEGASSGEVTAITLVAGVEPILAASPKGGGEMVLSPWSLGGGGGEDSGQ